MKIFLALFFLFIISCGVKGKPLPPENPRDIGLGKPSYEGVNDDLKKTKLKKKQKKEISQ